MIHYEHNGVVVRDARAADVTDLDGRLREADAKEVIAYRIENEAYGLGDSFARSSLRFTVDLDGVPMAMFGIVPDTILGPTACVWLFGADGMNKIKKTFVKCSRQVIADFLIHYPVLWNVVDGRYVSSIRWLKSCGAVFNETPVKIGGVDFFGFEMRRA